MPNSNQKMHHAPDKRVIFTSYFQGIEMKIPYQIQFEKISWESRVAGVRHSGRYSIQFGCKKTL